MQTLEHVEILLAEDSEADGEMILRALRRNPLIHNVIWVRDGAEALDFIFRRGIYHAHITRPRLILLDSKMPKVGGIEVLRQIKETEALHDIPVIILTSCAEDRDIRESYRLGANSYVVKPVDFAQFTDMVSRLGYYWSAINRVSA